MRRVLHLALLEQEAHAVDVAFGSGEVERSATVVVRQTHVDAAEKHPAIKHSNDLTNVL